MSLKVLNKKEIGEMLDKGYAMRYDSIYAKAYMQDNAGVILGAVRFDTFLKMVRQLVKVDVTFTYELYKRMSKII